MQKVIKVDEETHTRIKELAAKKKTTIQNIVKEMLLFFECVA